MEVVYEDKYCKLTSESLEIYSYYFPFGSNTIEILKINRICLLKGSVYRISGSGDFVHWWAGDFNRLGKATLPSGYIMITVENDYIIKCFTCENAERLLQLLQNFKPTIIRENKTSIWG